MRDCRISMNRHELIEIGSKVATVCLCMLLGLCLCVPAQSQIIKIPFLAVTCIAGGYTIIHSRGKIFAKQIWIWMGLYCIYNLAWSLLGFANDQPGASNNFRLGVIWTIVFLFILAVIDTQRIKWIDAVMICVLLFQTIAIVAMVGYGFQWWPNLVAWLFPKTAVGIHLGYVQVTGHFIGGMAFSVPYVYCRLIIDPPKKKLSNILSVVFFGVVIQALVASSRRMLLIVLTICVLATIVVAFLQKEYRKAIILRSVCGLILTALFLSIAAVTVSAMTAKFLDENFDEIYELTYKRQHTENGKIKNIKNVVLDIKGTEKYIEIFNPSIDQIDPVETPVEPPIETPIETPVEPPVEPPIEMPVEPPVEPSRPSGFQQFVDRIISLTGELTGDTARGRIISGALKGWKDKPIIGAGFGAELPGYEKEIGNGTYEMEYVVRLYTTGALGISALLGMLLYIGVAGIKQMQKSQEKLHIIAPCLVAYLGAVIATTSNPYIFSGFDFLWMLFLPIAFLNCCMKEEIESEEYDCLREGIQ